MIAQARNTSGLTLMESLIVVAVLTALIALLLPGLARSRVHVCRINCSNNVKQIGLSFRQWALDNTDKLPMEVSTNDGGAREWAQQGIAWPVFSVMSNELNTPKILSCPADSNKKHVAATTFGSTSPGSSYPLVSFTNNQSLSYFVSLDASQTQTNLLLSGDSHFEMGGKELTEGLHRLSSSQKIG